MIRRVINSKSKTFLAFCFCFLIGNVCISLADIRIDPFRIYLAFLVLGFFLVLFWQKKNIRFALFCFLFFTFGVWRFLIAFPLDSSAYVSYYNGEEKTITGYVSAEPDIRSDGVRYIMQIGREGAGNANCPYKNGNIYFKSDLYPRYEYGDVLEVVCDLKAPEPIEDVKNTSRGDFRYDMYLARFGVFSICRSPHITENRRRGG